MHGRNNIRLLAISLITLAAPTTLPGQRTAETARLLTPERAVLPPTFKRPVPPLTIALRQITRAAGTIFSGRVTAITRTAPETIAITFRVERALRGAVAGKHLTITQWTGMWTAGQRYRVGEHVFLFLYPPSKLGLTSCVAGPLGRFTVNSLGRVIFSEQHSDAFHADPLLGGKSSLSLTDFSEAVVHAGGED